MNGKILPAHSASVSIFDRGLVLGDGLFETLRAVHGIPEFLGLHYRRLDKSAHRIQLKLPLGLESIASLISKLCRKSRLDDAAVRITLTRGQYLGGLSIDPTIPPTLIVSVQPVSELSPKLLQKGVRVAVSSINKAAASGLDPKLKSINYLANIFARAEADKKGCFEAILLGPDNQIAELSTSSFFAVFKGILITPPIGAGILPGITRQILLGICKKRGIRVVERPIFLRDLKRMQEAFLTSSVRGLVPIARIEKTLIGSSPGRVYRILKELYEGEREHFRQRYKS